MQLNNFKLLQKQLNPHFNNNTLNAIQNLILINDSENALKNIALFGKYLTLIYEQSKKSEISLEEELELIKIYLALQKFRFKDKLNIILEIDPLIMEFLRGKFIQPFIIKAFVENSIEHGIFHNKSNGELKIQIEKENELAKVTIEDDGIGMIKSKQLNKWKNINESQSSLILIKKLLGDNMEIIINEKMKDKKSGTKIIVKI